MKRTVRCLALLALGAGAWACRGNPISDLDRGTATRLDADPSILFVENGAEVGVIVEAKDALNQVVEMSDIAAAGAAGLAIRRDSMYNRIYDTNGNLVLPENPTRARFVVTGTAPGLSSFTITSNDLSLTVPARVLPLSLPATVSQSVSGGGGLNVIRLTAAGGYSFAADASVKEFESGGPTVFMNAGVAADGSYLEYVTAPNEAGTPVIEGVMFVGVRLELPADQEITAGADPGFTTNDDPSTAPALAFPAAGESTSVYDNGAFGTGNKYYNFTVTETSSFSVTLDWPDHNEDFDVYVRTNPALANSCGTGGASLNAPEKVTCTDLAPGDYTIEVEPFGPDQEILGITIDRN